MSRAAVHGESFEYEGILQLRVVKMPVHLRASLTANDEIVDRALPIFAAARKEFAE